MTMVRCCCRGRRAGPTFAAGVVVALLLAASSALAHKSATGVLKQRMDDMKALKAEMKTLAAMVKRKARFTAARVRKSAAVMETAAGRMARRFPKGSLKKPSEAKPEVWTQWDKFTGEIAAFQKAASGLGAVKTFDALMPAFQAVGGRCQSCHKAFKVEN